MKTIWCANVECNHNNKGNCMLDEIHLHSIDEFNALECKCYELLKEKLG